MPPQFINRDDLLDDSRFWCLLYEQWIKPCVGDTFTEGEDYFFSIREQSVLDLFHQLEKTEVSTGSYPAITVLMDMPAGWRAGVALMLCPEDFEIDYVIVPPNSKDHKIIGVHGGNHWLPALRWEEVLILARAVQPATAELEARGVLLFYPCSYPSKALENEVAETLRRSWKNSGLPIRHLDQWVLRTGNCVVDFPWKQDPVYGWICESDTSLRNPKWIGRHHRWTHGMLDAVADFFATLDAASGGSNNRQT